MITYGDYNGFLAIKGIDRDLLDLDKTLDCGQCFRWEKLPDGTWLGVVNNKIFMVKHKLVDNIPSIITTATINEWENTLEDYFDLHKANGNYLDYDIKIPYGDEFANKAYHVGKGIRILRQDPWEALISFIISQRNNIPKIKSTVEKLCKCFGDKISLEVNGTRYEKYTFPSTEIISKLNKADLIGIGLGYRDVYILNAADSVINKHIELDKLQDNSITGEEVIQKLTSLYGVGPKVANCVALFGLHKLDTFPIDIWMQRIIDRYYSGNINTDRYANLAGLVQQYMFYYIRFNN